MRHHKVAHHTHPVVADAHPREATDDDGTRFARTRELKISPAMTCGKTGVIFDMPSPDHKNHRDPHPLRCAKVYLRSRSSYR